MWSAPAITCQVDPCHSRVGIEATAATYSPKVETTNYHDSLSMGSGSQNQVAPVRDEGRVHRHFRMVGSTNERWIEYAGSFRGEGSRPT